MQAATAALDDRRCVAIRPARKGDLPGISGLLEAEGLPTAGVGEWLERFWVAEHRLEEESVSSLAGVAGLEVYGDTALLRSVAIAPAWRGTGLGRQLTERALETAAAAGVHDVFLLTTTAEHYFPRLGFVCLARQEAPPVLGRSAEFCGACPESAVLMRRAVGSAGEPVPAR